MTTDPKPGNEPDRKDMADATDGGHASNAPADGPNLEAEEEAARLGDFA